MTTLLLSHDDCLGHEMHAGHPERPDRLRAVAEVLKADAFAALVREDAPLGTRQQVTRVHPDDYFDDIEARQPHEGLVQLDADTAMGPGSWNAGLRCVGAMVRAVEAVVARDHANAFCAVRPPGHHAERRRSMGFCWFNSAAIGAYHARAVLGLERVAVVDFDVHHGNGTQDIFWEDESVLFVSLHQDNLFPLNWGKVEDCGEGDASGTTVNIPLPAGSGNAVYLAAMNEIVLPIVEQFAPDMIMISAGQDASIHDPLGRMTVTVPAYREMSRMLKDLAESICDGRLIVLQEGGYSNYYAPYCAAAVIESMMLDPTRSVEDPFSPRSEAQRYTNDVGLDQREALDVVIATQKEWWNL